MNEKRIFGSRKGYSSLFLVIIVINLISIIVLSIFNYYVFHRLNGDAYKQSFLSYNQRITNLAFDNIDRQIVKSALYISQIYFSTISEDNPLILPQEEQVIQSAEKVRSLIRETSRIQKTYPYVKSMDIYYEGTQTIVTDFDKVHVFDDKAKMYIPWYETYRAMEADNTLIYEPEGVYQIKEPIITFVRKISWYGWKGKDIVLAIHILPSSFSSFIDLEGGELTLVLDGDKILYDSESGGQELPVIKEVLTKMEGDSGFVMADTTDGDVTVLYKKSAVSGLTYCYRMDNQKFYEDFNITNHVFIINFIISIAFNLFLLLAVSYYNHRVYKDRVLKMTKDAGIKVEEGRRSFDSSLSVLTKEISNLNDTINSTKGLWFQSLVRSMILERKAENTYEELADYLEGDSVCTFLLCPKNLESISVEALQEQFPPKSDSYHVLFTTIEKEYITAIVIFNQDIWDETRREFVERVSGALEGCRIVSGLVTPLNELKDSYKSAAEALQYLYIFTGERILTYESIHIERRKGHGSHLKLFEAMRKDISQEDFLSFITHTEYLVTSFKTGNYTIEYCMSTLRDLVTLLYQTMQQYQLDMRVVFGYDIRVYYKQIPNIDMYSEWITVLCEMILKNIRQKKHIMGMDTDVKAKILRLVEENLENNITLDFLADQLHVRPDEASRMFRQVMGQGYTEYIKERKLNRAIELMKEGSSVKMIAERLGYSSAQYFIKVFKESYGTTPYQYKKELEKEKEE